MTASTPKGRDIAKKFADDFSTGIFGLLPAERLVLESYFKQAITQAVNEFAEEASNCGDGIIVHSAEATNLVTTIRGRILKLKAAYGKGEQGG